MPKSNRIGPLIASLVPLCFALGCGGDDSAAATGDGGFVATDASRDATTATDGGANGDGAKPDGGVVGADGGDGGAEAAAPSIQGFVGGTNLSGAEFGPVPGVYGADYTYPTHAEIDYFTAKGFRVVRIPFLWERLQPSLGQGFDVNELARLTDVVTYTTSKGAYALIDPHDYARYGGKVIGDTAGGSTVTTAEFAAFWGKLAAAFAKEPRAVFGLMNEPHDLSVDLWLADANAAISAIRAAGARNVVFVPGDAWTGAHSWLDNSNAAVMLGIKDPIDNYVYEVHQYLDSDFSGTHATCVSTTIGSETLVAFTQWLKQNQRRGFLGEFGAANNATCMTALDDMLAYIDKHRDVWVGWTWWSAGPWWGNYMFSIEPANGQDAPQTATLVKHL